MADEKHDKGNWFKRHKVWTVIIAFVVLAGIGSAMGTDTASVSTDEPAKSEEKAEEKEQTYGVNEPVQVGDVKWTVTKVENRGTTLEAGDGFTEPKQAAGKFIQVTYKVENLGKEMKTTVGVDLEDSQERQFTPIDDGFLYIPNGENLYILDNLNPNVPSDFVQIYEIPADAKGLKARVGNLEAFGNEVKLINLGI
ncbi:MAG: DUF4352 domain-containing protein [Patescibacteria group bacterium]